MEFIATKPGFFDGSLRAAGFKFEAPDNFKASWAVKADTLEGKATKPAKQAKESPKTLSETAAPGKSFVEAHEAKNDLA